MVATTQPNLGEYTGIGDYIDIKVKAAQLIEPGSIEVLSAIGDENNALLTVTSRIGMAPGGTLAGKLRS